MTVEQVAADHHKRSTALTLAAVLAARAAWGRIRPESIDLSFLSFVWPQLDTIVRVGQAAAAGLADPYAAAVLDELGLDDAAERRGRLQPDSFAGTAADGRRLETLLLQPVVTTKIALARGASTAEALASGEAALARIVQTEVADAGRTADGAAIVTRPVLVGYVRLLTPPSCARCAILAGRFYRWNEGFERHPNCDCRHIPATEDAAGDARTDPRAAVLDGLVRGLSRADRQAIEDGADVAQVVNAHRGMYSADGRRFTREGTSRRGLAGQRAGRNRARLRPETIYREARDRDDAIRLLREYAYIV